MKNVLKGVALMAVGAGIAAIGMVVRDMLKSVTMEELSEALDKDEFEEDDQTEDEDKDSLDEDLEADASVPADEVLDRLVKGVTAEQKGTSGADGLDGLDGVGGLEAPDLAEMEAEYIMTEEESGVESDNADEQRKNVTDEFFK